MEGEPADFREKKIEQAASWLDGVSVAIITPLCDSCTLEAL